MTAARWISAVVGTVLLIGGGANAESVPLSRNDKALWNVTTAKDATPRVQTAARTLAEMLTRLSGAKFEYSTDDGLTGIAVGLASDFPHLDWTKPQRKPEATDRERYFLKSHAKGVSLIGATDLAVENAVWDLLHRLGYRQFFPGKHWEIVPRSSELAIDIDIDESPDYLSRRIWYGFGAWDYAAEPYRDWCAKNRCVPGLELSTGHSYGGFIRELKAEFDQHPEYYALVKGERNVRPEAKLCLSNEALRKRIAQHAVERFRKDPTRDSISADPSDGGGWCECEECAKLGNVTDRALLLANDMAAAVNAEFPDKLVGMYAYAFHSPPPTKVKPHPQVVISVATAFLKGGLSLDEIMKGWSDLGTVLGVREYYSVNTWDRDLPARARGSNIDYLKRTIPEFHAKGARYLSAESSDNWGPNGLGYYVAARMLWDVKESTQTDALIDDFLTRAFGPAKEPMAEFYRQIDASHPHLVTTDQIGRMFRALEAAQKLADTPEIHARLDDLTLYARYVDLYTRYANAKDAQRQAAFEELIRHAYRMRATMLVHTKALYRDLAGRDKSVKIPDDCRWNVPEGKNPWKSSEPFSTGEFASYLKEGIDRYPLVTLDFTPVEFENELVSARPLKLPPTAQPGDTGPGRGKQTFLTIIEKAPATLTLKITGGLIAHYRDRGNVRVELVKLGGASDTGEKETPISEDRSVPPDGIERSVTLKMSDAGTYRITVSDGSDRTRVTWDAGTAMVIPAAADSAMNRFYSPWTLWFYVPKGTKMVGLFGGTGGEILNADGKPAFSLNDREASYYSTPVAEGQDGRLWRIRGGRGPVQLLTVPPYFARSPDELLLPKDVVDRDSMR
jgi:hypothetical protein